MNDDTTIASFHACVKRWRVKDGHLIHDGDCYLWCNGICTCGLLHHLAPMDYDERHKVYPKYGEEMGRHYGALDHVQRNPPPEPVPVSEEAALKILRDAGFKSADEM